MDLLTFTLLLGLALGHFAFIFTKTDFVVEYARVFGLGGFFKEKEYEEWKDKNDIDSGYHIYLRETYHSFWSKLVGCPFCLITFLSVVVSFFYLLMAVFAGKAVSVFILLAVLAAAGIGSLLYLTLILLYKKNFS